MKGKPISTSDWALLHGVTPATARNWARRGLLKSAEKVSGVWLVSEYEPMPSPPKKGRPKGSDNA